MVGAGHPSPAPPGPARPAAADILTGMKWALLAAIFVLIALISVVLAVIGMVRYRIVRRHRVSPGTPTAAPLTWLASPQAAARLHRRLSRALGVARDAVERTTPKRRLARKPAPSALAPLVTNLEREALAIDEHLTLVQRLATQERRRLLVHLDGQVREVEGLAGRIAMLGARAAEPAQRIDDPPALRELAVQVEQLEAGRLETEALQRDVGLVTVPRLPAAGEPVHRAS